ncbi:DUF5117 domain-containing protein, partial [Mucilaginibacter conchicola]
MLISSHANAQFFKRLFGKNKQPTEQAAKPKAKTYESVINKTFSSYNGLFTVHKNKDTVYFEIPDSILNRDIMMINRLSQSSYGTKAYAGEELDDKTIQFTTGPDSTLRIIYNLVASEADSSSNVYRSVERSNRNPVAYVFPIVILGKHGSSYVIDVTKLFTATSFLNAINPQSTAAKTIDEPKDFKIAYIHAYPSNVEIGVDQNVNVKGTPDISQGSIQTNASFIMLPRVAMQRRYADDRIGYFT